MPDKVGPFSRGDVVTLKTDKGPKMCVDSAGDDGEIYCIWFDDNNQKTGETFHPDLLKKAS